MQPSSVPSSRTTSGRTTELHRRAAGAAKSASTPCASSHTCSGWEWRSNAGTHWRCYSTATAALKAEVTAMTAATAMPVTASMVYRDGSGIAARSSSHRRDACRPSRRRLRGGIAANVSLGAGAAAAGGGGGGGGGGKVRRVYVCSKCGARHGQYHGKCNKCGGFGTMDLEGMVEEPPPTRTDVGGGGGGGGAGVQALERVQQDTATPAANVSVRRTRVPSSYGDITGDDGIAAASNGGSRAPGWVADGRGGGGSGLEDVPLSLRALSHMGLQGYRDGRIALSGRTGAEVQRVLGGGVVPGALVLIGGDPGVGKSTITLQVAAMLAHPEIDFDALEEQRRSDDEDVELQHEYVGKYENDYSSSGADAGLGVGGFEYGSGEGSFRTVLYVTAEETQEQVVERSRRMGLDCCDRVAVLCRSEMTAISRAVLQLRPDAVVMDSINTVYLSNLPQAPGTVTQIRECGQLLLRLAKDHRVTVFIIGHVTKGGEMAGPNMLAHMVDTVLYLEGDVAQSVRLLRVVKNRHGSDAECGVFMMDATGLHAVANHSALFLENRLAEAYQGGEAGEEEGEDGCASSVVGITLQGSRAILVEVQALVSPLGDRVAAASSALSYRSATGIDKLRLANLCAILDKYVPTLELASCSVIVNVVGGTQVRDVASDLALAVAIASSYYNAPVPRDLAVCGEVDLAGRIRRSFQRLDVRVREAAKLGFRRVVIPQTKGWERLSQDPQLQTAGLQVLPVRSVAEALRVALGPGIADHRPPHIKPPSRGKPPPGSGPPGSRFARQDRTATAGVVAVPSIATDGSWPRAAALGGAAAAYAAAATVTGLASKPPQRTRVRGDVWAKEDTDGEYNGEDDSTVFGDEGEMYGCR